MKIVVKYFSIVFSLWLLGVIFGVVVVNNYEPSTAVESGIMQTLFNALDSGDHTEAFILVAANNLQVAAINIIGGILFGIPLLYN